MPALVLTPKLPYHVPNTLIKRMPNQLDILRLLLMMFSKFALVVALPVVASPPVVLSVTAALPLVAVRVMLLLIWLLFVVVMVVFFGRETVLVVTPLPSSAAVAPVGACTMAPTHLPKTFTNTSMSFEPMTLLPVRFKIVMLLRALPLVALPAVVLWLTVAWPVVVAVAI